eukprot:SAG25_NODE_744_length_5595_cov_111.883552_2_plen_223_part_00
MWPLRTSPCTLRPPLPRTVPSAPSPAPAASPSGPAVCEPAVVHERHCRCVRLVAHLVIPRRSGVSHRSTPHKRTAPLHRTKAQSRFTFKQTRRPVGPGNCPAKKKVFFEGEIRVGRERYSNITPIDAESCVGNDGATFKKLTRLCPYFARLRSKVRILKALTFPERCLPAAKNRPASHSRPGGDPSCHEAPIGHPQRPILEPQGGTAGDGHHPYGGTGGQPQ